MKGDKIGKNISAQKISKKGNFGWLAYSRLESGNHHDKNPPTTQMFVHRDLMLKERLLQEGQCTENERHEAENQIDRDKEDMGDLMSSHWGV
jgi:hypothetical protein